MKNRRCINTKRKGAKWENEHKRHIEETGLCALVVRQAKSLHPALIVFAGNVIFEECKTGRIRGEDIKKMSDLMLDVVTKCPALAPVLRGSIVTPKNGTVNFHIEHSVRFEVEKPHILRLNKKKWRKTKS
jgi:hypothetical protein